MRISDWSSDVCSSDLVIGNFNNLFMLRVRETATAELLTRQLPKVEVYTTTIVSGATDSSDIRGATDFPSNTQDRISMSSVPMLDRSEGRREGKEGVSTCRYRWSPDHEKKKKRQKK